MQHSNCYRMLHNSSEAQNSSEFYIIVLSFFYLILKSGKSFVTY